MPIRRKHAVRVAAVALCAAGVAAPQAVAAERAHVVAGTTVFDATTSGLTRITVPRDARLDRKLSDGSFSASRAGRVQGIVLRAAGAPITDTRTYQAAQVNFCFAPACTPAPDAPVEQHTNGIGLPETAAGEFVIPRGIYDAYVIGDGAPGSVTLRFHGLDGTTTIRPEQPAKVNIVSPTPAVPPAGAGPISFSTGTPNPIGDPGGSLFEATAISGVGPASYVLGDCFLPDGPPPGGNYHGCPGGYPQTVQPFTKHEPVPYATASMTWGLVYPRPWATGGWVDGAAGTWAAGHVSVAITYTKTEPPGLDDSDTPTPPTGPPNDRPRTTPPSGDPRSDGVLDSTNRVSGSGTSADRDPCNVKLRARRSARIVRLTARSGERCAVRVRLVSGRRTIARARKVLQPRRTATLKLRARTVRRLKLVVDTRDGAGNRARRSLSVR